MPLRFHIVLNKYHKEDFSKAQSDVHTLKTYALISALGLMVLSIPPTRHARLVRGSQGYPDPCAG